MGLDNYMEPILDAVGGPAEDTGPTRRVRVVHDGDYQTRGSYGLDTEEETKAAKDEEIQKLGSGEWVVLGFLLEGRCMECGSWTTDDSLWGVVVESSEASVMGLLKDHGFLNAEGKVSDAQS